MTTERVNVKEKQKIAALAASGKSQRAIGRATGRDNKTIAKVLKEPGVIVDRAKMEERLANKFEQLSEAILDSVSHDDLLNATLQQKSISAGVMLDKSRVIRGQSNMNIAVLLASVVIEAGKQWTAPGKPVEPVTAPIPETSSTVPPPDYTSKQERHHKE